MLFYCLSGIFIHFIFDAVDGSFRTVNRAFRPIHDIRAGSRMRLFIVVKGVAVPIFGCIRGIGQRKFGVLFS